MAVLGAVAMTPGARSQMTMEILDGLTETHQPADRYLERWFRERRFAGSSDRNFITDLVFVILRRWGELAWFGGSESHRILVITALVRFQNWSERDFTLFFDGESYRARVLSVEERQLVRELTCRSDPPSGMPVSAQGSFPDWLTPDLEARFGARLLDEMESMNQRAPVDLRVNTLNADREAALAALAANGIEADIARFSPLALRLRTRRRITGNDAIKSGLIEVQDEAAQLAALMVDARPGQLVADFCAGAGGKTLALAAMMKNSGLIHAFDVDQNRLKRMEERVERAGVRNVITKKALRDGGLDKTISGSFDRVLVDAPCSGSGTWRRNPETKWRLTPDALCRHISRQRHLLQQAGELVKLGGRLIYATCSVLHREGRDQIDWFSKIHPNFSVLSASKIWMEVLGTPAPMAGDYLELSPAVHGTDGFFVGILRRDE